MINWDAPRRPTLPVILASFLTRDDVTRLRGLSLPDAMPEQQEFVNDLVARIEHYLRLTGA